MDFARFAIRNTRKQERIQSGLAEGGFELLGEARAIAGRDRFRWRARPGPRLPAPKFLLQEDRELFPRWRARVGGMTRFRLPAETRTDHDARTSFGALPQRLPDVDDVPSVHPVRLAARFRPHTMIPPLHPCAVQLDHRGSQSGSRAKPRPLPTIQSPRPRLQCALSPANVTNRHHSVASLDTRRVQRAVPSARASTRQLLPAPTPVRPPALRIANRVPPSRVA